jgi:hypothetical protein
MPLRLAAASIDMTPREPGWLGGYAGRQGAWQRIADPLEACLLLLHDSQGARTVLLGLDTLYAGEAVVERARLLARRLWDIGPEAVLVAASHTHGAPMLDPTKSGIGRAGSAQIDRVLAALDDLFARVADLPVAAVRPAVAARASAASINRRLLSGQPSVMRMLGRLDHVAHAPNPAGPVDPMVRIMRFLGDDGATRAILWSFACHPTAFPDRNAVSADFIGVVRAGLRAVYGPVPVLFLQGFSGDVHARGTAADRQPDLWRTLLVGPHFPPMTMTEWQRWCGALTADVAAAAAACQPMTAAPGGRPVLVRIPLETLVDGPLPQRWLEVQGLSVGAVRLVAVSAEMLAVWGASLPADCMPVGCAGDTFGYLPDNLQAALGGYEGSRFFTAFGLGARRFKPAVDERVGEALQAVAATD